MSISKKLISILDHLMCSTNEIQILLLQERVDDILSEDVAHASVIQSPTRRQLVLRIGPENVAQKAIVGNDAGTLDLLDLGQRSEVWRQSTMHADDAIIDQGGDGKVLEALREGFPETNVVATLALVVETVNFVDVVGFVVPS